MRKLTIEIVDDNAINVELLRGIVEAEDEFEVAGCAMDGRMAVEHVKTRCPDAVLLDIIMPGMDGMAVLSAIRSDKEISKQPKILMVTAIGRDQITCEAFHKGADYYIMKPFMASELVKNIKMVCRPRENAVSGAYPNKLQTVESLELEQAALQAALESDIMEIFASLGISTIAGGYRYLRDAILMAVSEPQVLNKVTRDVYPVIAEKYSATRDNVERQIRRAIEVGWSRADLDAIIRYFGYTVDERRGKPTNSEFIAQIADHIRLDYMKQGKNLQIHTKSSQI